MLIYSLTAALVFSFILHKFYQDEYVRKSDIQAYLFIMFAALIWPITLSDIVRKVAVEFMNHRRAANILKQLSNPTLTYGAMQESTLK